MLSALAMPGGIARAAPTGTVTEFPLLTTGSEPFGIAAGPDGNLWFTESIANQIGRITPQGTVTEFPVPTASSGPSGIAAGPDGNLWFTEQFANQIGRVELAPSASISPSSLTFASQPVGTTSAAQMVTVSNTGARALAVSTVTLAGANPGDFALASDGCSGASVPIGGSCSVSIDFTPTAIGTRSASLVVTDNANDVPGSTQSAALSGVGAASADLGLSLGASPNPVHTGRTLTYLITVANNGPTGASNVVVTDALPSSTRFESVRSSQGSCTTPVVGSTGTVTCSLGSVANGANTTTSVAVTVIAAHKSTVIDTATVTSSAFDPNPANNSASVSVLMK
jgi:uncharacterized repeat protein (TIGR01451 family)